MPDIRDLKINVDASVLVNELAGIRVELEALATERDGLLAELGHVRSMLDEMRAKELPLLSCVDCRNTESCAGAMARQFNHGRCMYCGGAFKVVRA